MDGIDLEGALCAATAQHDRETTCHVGSPSEQRTVYRRSVAESGSFGLPRRGSATIAGANVSEATNAPTKASSTVIAIGAKVSPSTPVKVRTGTNTRKTIARPQQLGRGSCRARECHAV